MKNKRNTIQFSPVHPIVDLDSVDAIDIVAEKATEKYLVRFLMKNGMTYQVFIHATDVEPSRETLDKINANPKKYACEDNMVEIYNIAARFDLESVAKKFFFRACELMTHGRYVGEDKS